MKLRHAKMAAIHAAGTENIYRVSTFIRETGKGWTHDIHHSLMTGTLEYHSIINLRLTIEVDRNENLHQNCE